MRVDVASRLPGEVVGRPVDRDDRVAHWLTPTKVTRLPRRVVCLDAESTATPTAAGTEHRLRCAVASYDLLDSGHEQTGRTRWVETADAGELWAWIVGTAARGSRTMIFAHNVGVDLRLTRAFELLPELGFELKGVALTAYSCWARFSDGSRSLSLVDTSSWVHLSIAEAAGDLGLQHLPLPPWNAPDGRWLARCRRDVEILRALVLELLHFVRDDDLGDFRLTGAAQASACFRRRFLKPRSLLVHDDDEALQAERVAAWAGRCELWQHGRIDRTVYEYDYSAHYCTIAATSPVPGRLLGLKGAMRPAELAQAAATMAVLTEGVVTTEQPVVPCDVDGAVFWPIGRFATTLWEPEVSLLLAAGGSIEPTVHWLYERTDTLQAWAAWVLEGLAGGGPGTTAIRRAVLKGWSRALIGRFGLRYQDLEQIAQPLEADVAMFPVRDGATGEALTWLQIGRQLFERSGLVETADSLPQVTGWVMSEARRRLWAALEVAGLEHVLYIDTDGFLTTAPPRAMKRALESPELAGGLRRKGAWAGATLRSPRNIDVGHLRRIAGVPRKAAQVGPATFQYEAWETLPGSLRRSRADRVIVTERTATLEGRDRRRLHLAAGETAPHRVELVAGRNVLAD